MESIKIFFAANGAWMMELLMLAFGGLLTFRGLKVYKFIQAILCAFVGYSIGMFLYSRYDQMIFYALAFVLALVGGFLGVKYYKFGLYLSATSSAFLTVFSFFLRKALAEIKSVSGELMDVKEIFKMWLSKGLSSQDFGQSLSEIMVAESQSAMEMADNVVHIIQNGLMWAGIVSVIIGIMALVLGDFIIICTTSALGATVLVSLLGLFITMLPNMHLVFVLVLMSGGIILQSATLKKRK